MLKKELRIFQNNKFKDRYYYTQERTETIGKCQLGWFLCKNCNPVS